MDAQKFGSFLAKTRRQCRLTQAELAERLHVTDKAVSRWERGVGLPDINTLEPLADALGLSVVELMQCQPKEQTQDETEQNTTVLEFVRMLQRQSMDWNMVRKAMLLLSIALAVWGIVSLPTTVYTQLHVTGQIIYLKNPMYKWILFPGAIIVECFMLFIWEYYERKKLIFAQLKLMAALDPVAQFLKVVLDSAFFLTAGFLVPFCEMVIIFLN